MGRNNTKLWPIPWIVFGAILMMVTFALHARSETQKSDDRGLGGRVAAAAKPPEAKLNILKKNAKGQPIAIRDGAVLTQADAYALSFMVDEDAHAYVFQIDSKGNQDPLFPNSKFLNAANPVKELTTYRIPDAAHWFRLDQNKGAERIVLLAGKTPLADAAKTCRKVLEEIGKTRSAAGVRKTLQYAEKQGLTVHIRHFQHE